MPEAKMTIPVPGWVNQLNENQQQAWKADAMERATRGLAPLSEEHFRQTRPALFDKNYQAPTLPDGMAKRVDVR